MARHSSAVPSGPPQHLTFLLPLTAPGASHYSRGPGTQHRVIDLALASIAVEDPSLGAFKQSRGKVDAGSPLIALQRLHARCAILLELLSRQDLRLLPRPRNQVCLVHDFRMSAALRRPYGTLTGRFSWPDSPRTSRGIAFSEGKPLQRVLEA